MRRTPWTRVAVIALAAAATMFTRVAAKEPIYHVKAETELMGKVVSLKTIPDWMGVDGVNIALEGEDRAMLAAHVDVATAEFLHLLDFPIAVGDELKVVGCWSEAADGSPVFLVHELKKHRVTLNVRDPGGRPLW